MSFTDLEALYRSGSVPASFHALDGELKGRVLALRGMFGTWAAPLLRRVAASRVFVWHGKNLSADGVRKGTGINRIRIPALLGRQHLFPFSTRLGTSLIDRARTIVLDYDRRENPPYIRRIHDELREVSPGVFLGPAMWKTKRGALTLVWFALETGSSVPDRIAA